MKVEYAGLTVVENEDKMICIMRNDEVLFRTINDSNAIYSEEDFRNLAMLYLIY